jgi:cation:H+ antiporter
MTQALISTADTLTGAVKELALSNPLIFHSIVILLSFVLIAKASSYLVLGISEYAKKLGISDYLIGLIVVSTAASVPEFIAAAAGIAYSSSGMVFGTILGSNFSGITLALGIIALAGKNIAVKEQVFEKTKWDVLLLIALPFVLLADKKLGWIDGIILLSAFVIYLFALWKREGEMGKLKKKVMLKAIYMHGLIFALSLVTVLLASKYIVKSSLQVASILKLPDFIIASLVIGIGAQVPDIALGLHSLRKGHEAVAIGDVLGSMIIKSLLFLGIFALITPLQLPLTTTIFLCAFTIIACLIVFRVIKNKKMSRKEGVILLLFYALFLAAQFIWFK